MKFEIAWGCNAPIVTDVDSVPCHGMFKVGLHCMNCPHSFDSADLVAAGDEGDTEKIYPLTDEDVAQDAK